MDSKNTDFVFMGGREAGRLLEAFFSRSKPFREAVKRLADEGCDLTVVIGLLWVYSGPGPFGVEAVDQLSGFTPKRIHAVQRRINDLAEEIEQLNAFEIPGMGTSLQMIEEYDLPVEGPYPPEVTVRIFAGLPTALRIYAENLSGWPHPAWRKAYSDRELGKELFLLFVALYVKSVTGAFRYQELAALAEGMYAARGDDVDVDPENLRKAVASLKKRAPEVYEPLEQKNAEDARREYRRWLRVPEPETKQL